MPPRYRESGRLIRVELYFLNLTYRKAKNTRQFMRFQTKRISVAGVCLICPFFSLLGRHFAVRCYGILCVVII